MSVTSILLGINVVVFLLQTSAPGLIGPFALWPLATSSVSADVSFQPWQLVTYAFLHGSFGHIFFNMLGLYMFGGAIEQVFGARRYVAYYLVCVLSAGLTQLVFAAISGGIYPTVGASGGVFGLLLAYAIYFPHNRVMLIFPPIPMPARVFVVIYALIELVLGVTGTQEGVAHFAHLGGMLGGWVMLRRWRAPRAGGWPRR
jgi:membrane associated rhomboid family serine protease